MTKPTSKFGQFLARLKDKTSNLFKRGRSEEEEWEYEDVYEDDEEYEDDGDYENEYEDDATDPSFQTLTVTDIKLQNGDPPDLPASEFELDEDEEDYDVDDGTNPSFQEFEAKVPAGKLAFAQKFKEKFQFKMGGINTDKFFDALFSPQNRPKVHRTFLILLFTGSSYLAGKVITGILSPPPASKSASKPASNYSIDPTRKKLADMRRNDLFLAPEKADQPIKVAKKDEPKKVEPKICRKASKPSSLSLKLTSTVILQDEVKSLASVQARGKDKYLRIGDQIPNMIEVGNIVGDKLIFKNLRTRECEFIENKPKDRPTKSKNIGLVRDKTKGRQIIEQSKDTGIENIGNKFNIKKAVRQKILSNISEVLTQAKAVQIKNPDGSLSFRMQDIVPGSIYSKLNIQENDVINSINGKKITSMNELMSLFGKIDSIDHFEIGLQRQGIDQNLEYNFE